ncbi:MAG: ABC transporter substrate-binding protein [Verrucomicrobia bacterium]|nr:ABC transporter substrate-binding protein [Verrucomicrobiota bacterium]
MKRGILFVVLAVIVALPFALRPRRGAAPAVQDTVVIVTPHNEAIRYEYGRGFAEWYRERTGRTVAVDWRVLGGTSEIARFLEGEYVAAFEQHWVRRLGRSWSAEIQAGFQNGRLPAEAPAVVREARAAFLASEVGCGIDVFFGGGTYDFERQALAGRLVPSGLERLRPEWFEDGVMPREFGGEAFRDREGLWLGTVLSSYGILFNRDSLRRLGIGREPAQWEDLADPRLIGEVALADPTKSGSVAKAFENILQQQMQRRWQELRAEPGGDPAAAEVRAVREGWRAGLALIQRIGANARYFTDSSQKPPIDVAAGNCAMGLCIDFYGRQQEEAVRRRDRSDRIGYVSPAGGSAASVDPVALLRGARNRAAAVAFIEYSVSMEGQKLWNFRPGTPGGPDRFALRRLPVRRDFYTVEAWKPWRTDPGDAPFDTPAPLIYREAWTGRIFREMALVIRVMCHDTHPELQRAWRAIQAAPAARRGPALERLQDLAFVDYDEVARTVKARLGAKNKVEELRLVQELAERFRAHYRAAEVIATSG